MFSSDCYQPRPLPAIYDIKDVVFKKDSTDGVKTHIQKKK